jgi:hypothetical protein
MQPHAERLGQQRNDDKVYAPYAKQSLKGGWLSKAPGRFMGK